MEYRNRGRSLRRTAVIALAGSWLTLAASAAEGLSFSSPQAAVDALMAAVKDGSVDQIAAVLGPKGRELASSGDQVADETARQRFYSAYEESHELKEDGSSRAVLLVGKDEFPFPIPIVAAAGAWRFDTQAGAEEILDRRIGENEFAAIKVLGAYVDAQHEYAEVDHDGKGVRYAQRLLSSDGKQDGLYWPTTGNEPESPFGPMVAEARAENYEARSGGPAPLSRIPLPHTDFARQRSCGRGARLCCRRPHDWRVWSRRSACPVCKLRRHDVHRKPGRSCLRKRPRP